MNEVLDLCGRQLKLNRYPKKQQHKSEQAWEAADELLIEQVQQLPPCTKASVWIFNDDCGALTCFLSDTHPTWFGDSKVSELACKMNLEQNQLDESHVTFYNSLQLPSDQKPTLVLLKIPKTLGLLEHQLWQIAQYADKNTQIIAAGKVNLIQKNTLSLFEKYIGETKTSLARKKARLVFSSLTSQSCANSPFPTVWPLEHTNFELSNHANVFARQQLDIGARFMLQHLPDCDGKHIVDLGCGNGVLGLSVHARGKPKRVTFVDESFMAVGSAQMNIENNLPNTLSRSEFCVSNCLEQTELNGVDLVLCNPPFHQQQRITDHIAWQMFCDAKQRLKLGGELRIVGNRHLGYRDKLKRIFGACTQIAVNNKFVILSAIKR